jgi:hypothetical protein
VNALRDGRRALAVACAVALSLLAGASVVSAVDFSIDIAPGVAIPLSAPQSQLYEVGGAQWLKARVALTPFLDVGPSATLLVLPAAMHDAKAGIAWGLGPGLRLKWPLDRDSLLGLSPWLDTDALYVRTGELNRAGFAAAAGLAVPLGRATRRTRVFWVGPFLRYFHILQAVRSGYDSGDARMLIVGVSLEVRLAVAPRAPHR